MAAAQPCKAVHNVDSLQCQKKFCDIRLEHGMERSKRLGIPLVFATQTAGPLDFTQCRQKKPDHQFEVKLMDTQDYFEHLDSPADLPILIIHSTLMSSFM